MNSSNILPPPSFYFGQRNCLSYSNQWQQQRRRIDDNNNSNNNNKDSWYQHNNETVFGLSFLENNTNENTQKYNWLAGCTKSGYICIWMIGSSNFIGDDDDDDDNNNNNETLFSTSSIMVWSQKVTSGVLYECKFVPYTNTLCNVTNWLVVSGDGGVYLFHFEKQILPQLQSIIIGPLDNLELTKNTTTTVSRQNNTVNTIKPLYTYQTYPSPYEVSTTKKIEINDFVLNKEYIYGAGGDSFCYKWDIETQQCVQTYRTNNSNNTTIRKRRVLSGCGGDYLQTISYVPSSNLLLTGSDCGILSLWDTSQDELIEQWDMIKDVIVSKETVNHDERKEVLVEDIHLSNNNKKSVQSSRSNSPNRNNNTKETKRTMTSSSGGSSSNSNSSGLNLATSTTNTTSKNCSISSCIAVDENFWIVGGGINEYIITSNDISTRKRSYSPNSEGGYIATMHGPTRSWLSTIVTNETPQKLAVIDCTRSIKTNSSYSSNNTVVSVSNDNYVRYWDSNVLIQQQQSLLLSNSTIPKYHKVHCSTPSGYAIGINNTTGQLAVGGVGAIVNLYDNFNQPSSIPISAITGV